MESTYWGSVWRFEIVVEQLIREVTLSFLFNLRGFLPLFEIPPLACLFRGVRCFHATQKRARSLSEIPILLCSGCSSLWLLSLNFEVIGSIRHTHFFFWLLHFLWLLLLLDWIRYLEFFYHILARAPLLQILLRQHVTRCFDQVCFKGWPNFKGLKQCFRIIRLFFLGLPWFSSGHQNGLTLWRSKSF